jgi:hypothetical protein
MATQPSMDSAQRVSADRQNPIVPPVIATIFASLVYRV